VLVAESTALQQVLKFYFTMATCGRRLKFALVDASQAVHPDVLLLCAVPAMIYVVLALMDVITAALSCPLQPTCSNLTM
jgi:hypothetical protein